MSCRLVGRVVSLSVALLASCVPPLETHDTPVPRLRSIVNHVNCELASIVAARIPRRSEGKNAHSSLPPSPAHDVLPSKRVADRTELDPNIPRYLDALVTYHFVASVLLTLDVTDTEGIFPFLNFIEPLTSSFNRTVGVGGQVSGTQERNMTFSYSVDLANVSSACQPLLDAGGAIGIQGELGLADIVIDGLEGLYTSQNANIYGAGGPTRPPFNATVENLKLGLRCNPAINASSSPAPSPSPSPSPSPAPAAGAVPTPSPSPSPSASASSTPATCSASSPTLNLSLNGNVNFSPSADPQTPGTVSFAGNAKDDKGTEYLASLTGSTYQLSAKDSPGGKDSTLKFTLSGSMTREGSGKATVPDIGFSPTISLVGSVVDANDGGDVKQKLCGFSFLFEKSKGQLKNLCGVTGLLTGSAELPSTPKVSFLIGAPISEKPATSNLKDLFFTALASPGGGGASGAAASKGTGSSTSSGTQFGSLVNFMLSYGVEGGPNWTLSNFKGPGGGTGTASQLFSVSRSHTDSATITFVAACQDDINVERFDTYWQTIPKCNGTQQIQAANAGAQYNFLLQTGRGGR